MGFIDNYLGAPSVRPIAAKEAPSISPPTGLGSPYDEALARAEPRPFPGSAAVAVNWGTRTNLAHVGESHWILEGSSSSFVARRAARMLLERDPSLAGVAWRRFEGDARDGIHLFEVETTRNLPSISQALSEYPEHASFVDFPAGAAHDGGRLRNYAYAAVDLLDGVVDRQGSWRNPRTEPFIHTESRYEVPSAF